MKKAFSSKLFCFSAIIFTLSFPFSVAAQSWTEVPGLAAQDISIGKGGVVWAIGKNSSIYRFNGMEWTLIPGGATRVAVDPDGTAWIVNAGGQIFKYNYISGNWDLKPGGAREIAVGADGSVWVIGMNSVQGGYDIYRWNGNNWTNVPGGAVRIAVAPSGNAWVVNNTNNVFEWNGTSFVMKPGRVFDIDIGANGAIWCTSADFRIFEWVNNNWALRSGGAERIAVSPDGHPWVVNSAGQVFHTGPAQTVKVKTLFPREQTFEYAVLRAMKYSTFANEILIGGQMKHYSNLSDLDKAFGKLALMAAEFSYAGNMTITAQQALDQIQNTPNNIKRNQVAGILGVLLINEVQKTNTDPLTMALKNWATDLYRSVWVRSAKAVLDEYGKWKNDWCTYEGISPEQCRVQSQGISSLFASRKPPQDLIGKNGLKALLDNNADAVAVGTSLGLAAVGLVTSFGVLTSVMTFGTAATTVSLFTAFGAKGVSILGAGFAGVVAAPIAAAILCIVVGTIEGYAVIEAAKLEPMLKMKLGAAMTSPINIINVMADSTARDMFFIGFMESATKNFSITPPKVNGEVRFYCQAGYVSSFRLTYTLNGQAQTFTTPDLAVGQEKSFSIPYNATNIRVQGWYALGGWKELFNVALDKPTYICYTSYGTVFEPKYKTDCPEVGSMVTQPNQLTITQGGGYVAWIRLEYNEGGQTKRVLDKSDCPGGWRQVFTIPATATNIRLQAWSNTGLIWEPWKIIIDKTWPSPPNECIKVYNTTLDPKWNNECN